jgi:hypothetical protein
VRCRRLKFSNPFASRRLREASILPHRANGSDEADSDTLGGEPEEQSNPLKSNQSWLTGM